MNKPSRVFYSLNEDDIQLVAKEKVGRKLTIEEIEIIEDKIAEKIIWYDIIEDAIVENLLH